MYFHREKVGFAEFRHFTTAFQRRSTNSLKPVSFTPVFWTFLAAGVKTDKTRTYSNLTDAGHHESARFARFVPVLPVLHAFLPGFISHYSGF